MKSKAAGLASGLCKAYEVGDVKIEVLNDVDLKIGKSEFVVINGPSGSGQLEYCYQVY